jgi:hypothetical protein
MFWGEGSTLGLLTCIGYLVFVLGSAIVWRGRDEMYVWIQDETGAIRRSFSRYTVVGPFYTPREDSRLKAVPASVVRSFRRIPRNPITGGMFLMFLGPLLILLDFFV